MTEQEFLDLAYETITIWCKEEKRGRYDYTPRNGYRVRNKRKKELATLDDFLLTEWTISSVCGGSWQGGDNYASPGDTEPSLIDLDTLLDKICPQITYREYRELISGNLVEYSDYTRNEYYGNSTTLGYKKVALRRLWNKLTEMGIIK